MIRWVERILSRLLLAPALLPLVYMTGVYYPYVSLKTFFFRALGVCVAAALVFLILTARGLSVHRLRNKIAWIPLALLIVAYVTSLIGVDFYHSFWSTFERGDGLITLIAAVLFFYGTLLYADTRFLIKLGKIVAWVGGLVALYALLQWGQAATGIHIPLIEDPRGRVGATFGNAAFMASYLAMSFFLTLIVVWEYRGRWQRTVYASAGLQLLAILIAATRGTILALIVAGACAALYLAWKGEMRSKRIARISLVVFVVIACTFFFFRGQLAAVPIAPIQRIATISLSDGTIASRFFLWRNIGLEALKTPLTGVGAEHIEVLFNRAYDPDQIQEEWFDRSHNAFLDYFAQFGILGLVLYLALIFGALGSGYRICNTDTRIGGLVILLVITYAVQNFFVFDTALTLWLFITVCAAAIAYGEPRVTPTSIRVPRIPKEAAAGIAATLLILIWPISIQPLRANRLLMDTYLYHVADIGRAEQYLQAGLSLNTFADLEYGYNEYVMYTGEQVSELSGDARFSAYELALGILKKNFEKYPYDARTAVYLAHVLDLTPPEVSVDDVLLNHALDRALLLSPRRMQPWYIRANISLKKGDTATTKAERAQYYTHAIEVMQHYADMQPQSADSRYIIANLYLAIGDKQQAEEWANAGEEVYRGGEAARRAAKYYINAQEWGKAVRFLSDVVASSPDNAGALYDLAKVKFLSGDTAGAKEIYERLKTQNQNLVATDPAFVQAIEAK